MNPALDSLTDGGYEEHPDPELLFQDNMEPAPLWPLPYYTNRIINLDASREGAEVLRALYTRMAQKIDAARLMKVSIDQPDQWPEVVRVANEELVSAFGYYHTLDVRLKYKRRTIIGLEAMQDLTVRCIFPEKN